MLNKLKEKGIKCNIEKSFFGQTEMEYLGFWVTRDGVKPINGNIKAITNMAPPTSRKEVQNVYRFNKVLLRYVVKAVTYVSAFN